MTRFSLGAAALLLIIPCFAPAASQSPGSAARWQTLTGSEPLVVARGGFSGLFPDSSSSAYVLANLTSLKGVVSWCDVQLTKDGVGICLPEVNLANCTDAQMLPAFANQTKTYSVNGRQVRGLFTTDYTYEELSNVTISQAIYSRTDKFDSLFFINVVEQVYSMAQSLWLNVEHDLFYKEHRLSMVDYINSISGNVSIDYISSPEIGFLKAIGAATKGTRTELVFRFLELESQEPTTNRTYGSLLKDLKFISTFASGIIVPKRYIWPVTPERFLLPYTSLVSSAHNASLKVFASDLANDFLTAYNYSYNPVNEYLSFIDNGDFAVDGLISDFPVTASEAIACFSHLGTNSTETGKPLVISNNGDSGDFPGCTDLAYKYAVDGGADVIDCNVQVTKDGLLVCLSSIDLMRSTSVTKSKFATSLSMIPEIQGEGGIFTFNLTWDEINTLKPVISSPFLSNYSIERNPANENAGRFMSLKDFLVFAKDKPLKGVLIRIENARFLVETLDFDIVRTVIATVSDAAYDTQSDPQVMVMSSSSSTLIPFRQKTMYKIVYMVDELVGDVDPSALDVLKTFAHSVALRKEAIFPVNLGFISSQTQVVQKLQSANLSVYAYGLMNEFLSIPWDFFSDPYVEIQNLVQGASVDGVITDFPATARSYRRNACSKAKDYQIPDVQPHALLDLLNGTQRMPPELTPYQTLTGAAVSEQPLTPKTSAPPSPKTAGGQPHAMPSLLCAAALFLSSLSLIII